MTTPIPPDIAIKPAGPSIVLPDPPRREPDASMTSFKHLHSRGNAHHVSQYLGNPDTTLVSGELYITMMPERRLPSGSYRRYPDLLIAFDVDPDAYHASNGYIISQQGKPPDFVLEVASRSTGEEDTGPKRNDYEALGITEYWRFDETGQYHGARLAGDRLVDGHYHPIPIEELPGGVLQGYSEALNIFLRWEQGNLAWHNPATGRHIDTFDSEREARRRESARADREQQARLEAEARVRELEARLDQQDAGQ